MYPSEIMRNRIAMQKYSSDCRLKKGYNREVDTVKS